MKKLLILILACSVLLLPSCRSKKTDNGDSSSPDRSENSDVQNDNGSADTQGNGDNGEATSAQTSGSETTTNGDGEETTDPQGNKQNQPITLPRDEF